MAERNRAEDRAGATDVEIYLPAGYDPSFVASGLEWIWARLFDHGIETST